MNKFFLLTNFLLFNSIITVHFRIIEEQNKTESNEKKGIFCKIDDSFLCKHTAIFFLILFIIILLVVVGSCLFIKYCYERHPFLRGWERIVAQRLSLQREKRRKEEELLEKKKKYYLLNIEIKSFSYNKELMDFGEKCPICLENYNFEKEVCLTPCKHLFHHLCLKQYIYGIFDVKCPICKYNLFDCLKGKKINYNEITITDDVKIYNREDINNEILNNQNLESNNVIN